MCYKPILCLMISLNDSHQINIHSPYSLIILMSLPQNLKYINHELTNIVSTCFYSTFTYLFKSTFSSYLSSPQSNQYHSYSLLSSIKICRSFSFYYLNFHPKKICSLLFFFLSYSLLKLVKGSMFF